jgi:hypothetical protein
MTEKDATLRAVDRVLAGQSILSAARAEKIARSTLISALRRRGVEPRKHPSGPAHHNYGRHRAGA